MSYWCRSNKMKIRQMQWHKKCLTKKKKTIETTKIINHNCNEKKKRTPHTPIHKHSSNSHIFHNLKWFIKMKKIIKLFRRNKE